MKTIFVVLMMASAASAVTPSATGNNCSANTTGPGGTTKNCTITGLTAGNQLVVTGGSKDSALVSFTDNAPCGVQNTYTNITNGTGGLQKEHVAMVSSIVCSGSLTVTLTVAAGNGCCNGPLISVVEYQNIVTTLDGAAVVSGPLSHSGSTYTCTGVTVSGSPNDLVVAAFMGLDGGGTSRSWTAGGGSTISAGASNTAANWATQSYQVVSSAGTYTPTFIMGIASPPADSNNVCIVMAFTAGTPPTNLCISVATGNASAAGTWSQCGGGTPTSSGYTAKINDGHTVTWDTTSTVGLGTTTAAITLNNTGKLSIAAGVTLTVNGPITYTAGTGNTTDGVVMQAGSSLVGVLASGVTQLYGVAGAINGRRPFNSSACTSGSHCSISASGAGISTIGDSSVAGGGSINLAYTDLTSIGDATHDAIALDMATSGISYSVTHSTFTSCGRILTYNGFNPAMPAAASFSHTYNVHTGGLGTTDIVISASSANLSGGTRQIVGNVLPVGIGGDIILGNFTITDNYIVGSPSPAVGTANGVDEERNLGVCTSSTCNNLAQGTMKDLYAFVDGPSDNPHYFLMTAWNVAQTLDGFLVQQSVPGAHSGVVFYAAANPSSVNTVTIKNTIILPSSDGSTNGEFSSPQGASTTNGNQRFDVQHNTMAALLFGYGQMNNNESGNSVAGLYTSISNNALWSNPRFCSSSCYMKTWNNSCNSGAATALAADYNFADQYLRTAHGGGCDGSVNGGAQVAGYDGIWTGVTPGAHDIASNAQFIDYDRSLITFPTRYLGLTAGGLGGGAWVTSTAYTVGQVVSDANASVYGGLTILYRCTVAHTSAAGTEPGVGATWQTKWEWYGLYSIRADMAAGRTYVDGALPGCTAASPCQPVMARIAWIRRGFAPQNSLYRKAGGDGTSPGAVNMDAIQPPVIVQ